MVTTFHNIIFGIQKTLFPRKELPAKVYYSVQPFIDLKESVQNERKIGSIKVKHGF